MSTYTNSNLAAKRNLAKELAKKNTTYSNGKLSSKQASVSSAEASTSDRSLEGNHSKFIGSGKGKKGSKGILSLSHSKHLLHRVNQIKGRDLNVLTPNVALLSLPLLPISAGDVILTILKPLKEELLRNCFLFNNSTF